MVYDFRLTGKGMIFMLNWIKSIGLRTEDCTDGKTLDMIKKAGFGGIDLQYPEDFFQK